MSLDRLFDDFDMEVFNDLPDEPKEFIRVRIPDGQGGETDVPLTANEAKALIERQADTIYQQSRKITGLSLSLKQTNAILKTVQFRYFQHRAMTRQIIAGLMKPVASDTRIH